jgi:prepilin-type N-terminal cleavage/methylation domain-containing protein
MKSFKKNERGFTLVELLVAIPIIGLLGLAAGAVLIQLLHSDRVTDRMVAVRQAQAAGDRVSQDGVQAQYVTFGDDMTDGDGFLVLTWSGEWVDDSGDYVRRTESVTYTMVSDHELYNLERHEVSSVKVGAAPTVPTDVISTVAQHLDVSQMSCQWEDTENTVFSFKVVSTVGAKTEERTYNISPRPQG